MTHLRHTGQLRKLVIFRPMDPHALGRMFSVVGNDAGDFASRCFPQPFKHQPHNLTNNKA